MIMVGPGTGIAPFRGFLQERRALGHGGRNWLFFGDQHRSENFYYCDDLEDMVRDGFLNRLDLAFSRDQDDRVYVQHKMLDHGADVWRWLDDGAHLYVCGAAAHQAHAPQGRRRRTDDEHPPARRHVGGRRPRLQTRTRRRQTLCPRRLLTPAYWDRVCHTVLASSSRSTTPSLMQAR